MGESVAKEFGFIRRAARALGIIVLGSSMTLQFGCAPTAVIAAASVTAGFGLAQGQAEAFIRGELQAARLVPMDEVMEAVVAAMDELQLHIKTKRMSSYNGYLMAKAKGGREIQVSLRADSPVMTKISVRVGLMGDQAVSRLVLLEIDEKLGVFHPIVVPVEHSPTVKPATQPAMQPYIAPPDATAVP